MSNIISSFSNLSKVLSNGEFAITAETTPKATTDINSLIKKTIPLKGLADAVNVTDGAGAKSHLSSLILALHLLENDIEPILQLTLRDRNIIAIQSEVLGAASVGISNILSLTGDPVEVGDESKAKFVGDFPGSNDLIRLLVKMRDKGSLNSGREIHDPPKLFLGAADSPIDPPKGWIPEKIKAKIASGAQFIQTQYCFDIELCRRYFSHLSNFGILDKCYFLLGIGPFKSSKQAEWINNNLPGVNIPEDLIKRIRNSSDQKKEGINICVELIHQLKEIQGISGVHVMGPGQEESVARIIELSGVIKDRKN